MSHDAQRATAAALGLHRQGHHETVHGGQLFHPGEILEAQDILQLKNEVRAEGRGLAVILAGRVHAGGINAPVIYQSF
jgi:hypothetical protein